MIRVVKLWIFYFFSPVKFRRDRLRKVQQVNLAIAKFIKHATTQRIPSVERAKFVPFALNLIFIYTYIAL